MATRPPAVSAPHLDLLVILVLDAVCRVCETALEPDGIDVARRPQRAQLRALRNRVMHLQEWAVGRGGHSRSRRQTELTEPRLLRTTAVADDGFGDVHLALAEYGGAPMYHETGISLAAACDEVNVLVAEVNRRHGLSVPLLR